MSDTTCPYLCIISFIYNKKSGGIMKTQTLRSLPEKPSVILAIATISTSGVKSSSANKILGSQFCLQDQANFTMNLQNRPKLQSETSNYKSEQICLPENRNLPAWQSSDNRFIKVERPVCGCKNQDPFLILCAQTVPIHHKFSYYPTSDSGVMIVSSTQSAVNLYDIDKE